MSLQGVMLAMLAGGCTLRVRRMLAMLAVMAHGIRQGALSVNGKNFRRVAVRLANGLHASK